MANSSSASIVVTRTFTGLGMVDGVSEYYGYCSQEAVRRDYRLDGKQVLRAKKKSLGARRMSHSVLVTSYLCKWQLKVEVHRALDATRSIGRTVAAIGSRTGGNGVCWLVLVGSGGGGGDCG